MPDMIGVLFDSTVRREVAHIGNVQHRFCGPLFLKLVEFVDFILTIDIAAIIRQYLVVIAEVDDEGNLQLVKIDAAGSRIIPMDAAVLSDFDKGNTKKNKWTWRKNIGDGIQ